MNVKAVACSIILALSVAFACAPLYLKKAETPHVVVVNDSPRTVQTDDAVPAPTAPDADVRREDSGSSQRAEVQPAEPEPAAVAPGKPEDKGQRVVTRKHRVHAARLLRSMDSVSDSDFFLQRFMSSVLHFFANHANKSYPGVSNDAGG